VYETEARGACAALWNIGEGENYNFFRQKFEKV
jgi:hypothetical protein